MADEVAAMRMPGACRDRGASVLAVEVDELPGLADRVGALLVDDDATVVLLDVAEVAEPDLAAVDALARAQLVARQAGGRVQLCGASRALEQLLALTGLTDVLPCEPESGVGTQRQPEQREQRGGVEERADPHHPVA